MTVGFTRTPTGPVLLRDLAPGEGPGPRRWSFELPASDLAEDGALYYAFEAQRPDGEIVRTGTWYAMRVVRGLADPRPALAELAREVHAPAAFEALLAAPLIESGVKE